MNSNKSPRSSALAIIEADDFLSYYYKTAFGDAFEHAKRAQTLFPVAVPFTQPHYSDQHSPMSTPSPLLSSPPSLRAEWDTPELGLPTWPMDDPLS